MCVICAGEKGRGANIPRELVTVMTEQDKNATERLGRLIRAAMSEPGDLP